MGGILNYSGQVLMISENLLLVRNYVSYKERDGYLGGGLVADE